MFVVHLTMADGSVRTVHTTRVTLFQKNNGIWKDKGDQVLVLGTLPKTEWIKLSDIEHFWTETE